MGRLAGRPRDSLALTDCYRVSTLGFALHELCHTGMMGRDGEIRRAASGRLAGAVRCSRRGVLLMMSRFVARVHRRPGRPHPLPAPHPHRHATSASPSSSNGQYDQDVLRQMNVFLADWRTQEPTKMDPQLFDLLWEVYQDVGASQPINIVSSYRSPKTNAMLRAKSSAVAENSQHMRGKAMDVFIPGVDADQAARRPRCAIRSAASATTRPRAAPSSTWTPARARLAAHDPRAAQEGLPRRQDPAPAGRRQAALRRGPRYAQAEWNKCHMVPCNGAVMPSRPYQQ